jgi:lipopolysaccharide biosynthesis protein
VSSYDLLLHFHGKKSLHEKANVGDEWRTSSLEALVGPRYQMADGIVSTFCDLPDLGLVAPEVPNLPGWSANLAQAQELATRLGMSSDFPQHFDFPVGGMFWARVPALIPLLELGFTWESYPLEPVPVDGTMLHAIERLLPFVVENQGYTFAKSYIPNIDKESSSTSVKLDRKSVG